MKKYLRVSDKKKETLFEKILKVFLDYETIDNIAGKQAEDIIYRENAQFLMIDIYEPANLDMMNRLSLGSIKGLRVAIFKLDTFKGNLLEFFFPAELIEFFVSRYVSTNPNFHPGKEGKDLPA
jgi:hypothetical protein